MMMSKCSTTTNLESTMQLLPTWFKYQVHLLIYTYHNALAHDIALSTTYMYRCKLVFVIVVHRSMQEKVLSRVETQHVARVVESRQKACLSSLSSLLLYFFLTCTSHVNKSKHSLEHYGIFIIMKHKRER